MNYLKTCFGNGRFGQFFELFLFVLIALFLTISPMFLVYGDPFLLGPENKALALYYPLIALAFVGLIISTFFYKAWRLSAINQGIGFAAIGLALVTNAYFSADPFFNLYWLGFFLLLVITTWIKPFEIKADLAMILFLLGLIIGLFKSFEDPALSLIVLATWGFWYYHFFQMVKPAQQKIMWLLTVGFFLSFGYYTVGALFLLWSTIKWWKQKKNYRRKDAAKWGIGLILSLILTVATSILALDSFTLPVFNTLGGVGIYQVVPTVFQEASSVIVDSNFLNQSLTWLWYEWGISLLILLIGLGWVWSHNKNKTLLWFLFWGLCLTDPVLLGLPHFWLVLSFFTFSNDRFESIQS